MSKKLKVEAKRGNRDGLWRVFLEGEEIAMVTPMPWRHLAGVVANALAEGIDGLSEEEWQERYREAVLRGVDV